ncbi:MAG: peptidase S10 [Rhodoferax sp.]|nr:peptidase S10 [Rhodoferax sp.]MCF8208731.1 peptidase S10 [Rhodoferax sp.]
MAETSTPTPPSDASARSDEKKRTRERVEKLNARPLATSQGCVQLASGPLAYTANAGFVPVALDMSDSHKGEPDAAVFFTSYTRANDGVTAQMAARPILFAFNGGPGSSSVWLHLGALGPKRVLINDDGSMPPPPYGVQDNPHSWLEHFDLVFFDPPHTGYSLTASAQARKKMLGVDGDVDALAECVRVYLTRADRWGSPVYLAGESYGTTRGAALTDKLQSLGIALAGVILVSCAMDLQTLVFEGKNDLPYALFLPGFACVAQYHGKLTGSAGASPEAARAQASAFVHDEYLQALHRGAGLAAADKTRLAHRMSELLGLPAPLIEDHNLRISDECFFFELLRTEGRQVGRLEARVTGPMAARKTRQWEFDPGIEALAAPYTMAANAYMHRELGVHTDQRYEVLSMEVNKQWNWLQGDSKGNSFTSTSGALARALRRNPHLKVLVASGYYDLGTPYSASDYALAQLDVPPDVLRRVTHRYYDAGHMMYTRDADLRKLKADVAAWLEGG